jgi:hypothetical protein
MEPEACLHPLNRYEHEDLHRLRQPNESYPLPLLPLHQRIEERPSLVD